jgi:hypothetical protein
MAKMSEKKDVSRKPRRTVKQVRKAAEKNREPETASAKAPGRPTGWVFKVPPRKVRKLYRLRWRCDHPPFWNKDRNWAHHRFWIFVFSLFPELPSSSLNLTIDTRSDGTYVKFVLI